MAIGRSQIPKELEGGDIMKDMDKKYNDIDVFQEGGLASIQFPEVPDYQESFEQYQERLMPYVYQEPRMSIYDLASELGAGLLATPNVGGISLFQGLGTGFAKASERLKSAKAENAKARQQVALQAAQMAMQDEQQAKQFLQEFSLKQIDARNKAGEYITLEYTDPNGELISKTFRDNQANAADIDALLAQGATEVKTPASQTIINQGQKLSKRDEKAIEDQIKLENDLYEDFKTSTGVVDNVAVARKAAMEIGPENYGPDEAILLGPKKMIVGLGLADTFNLDPNVVAKQQVLNQLGMGFTMAIVSQTKGAISNKEMQLFINASPGLASTYDGYMMQLDYLDRVAQRQKQMYNDVIAEAERLEALEAAGEITPSQTARKLKVFHGEWAEKNPLFSDEETKMLEERVAKKTGLAEDFDVSGSQSKAEAVFKGGQQQPIQSPDAQIQAKIKEIQDDTGLSDTQKEELIALLLK